MYGGGPRDVALVQGELVSVENPMWNKNVPFSSSDSWVDVSGASAAEGALDREDSPQEDPLGWSLPRTPGKSPLRMEEGLSESFPFLDRPSMLPTPLSAVPVEFLQPSTSGTQQVSRKAPSVARSRFLGGSDSSVEESSVSSEEERRRRHRRKRERSMRRRSLSRSPSVLGDRRRRSRSPQKKSRRAGSPQGRWVFIPEDKLRDLTTVSRSMVKLVGDSPPRRASSSLMMASAADRKASSSRHKSRPRDTQPAQRRESSPRTSSLDGSAHRDEASSSMHKSRPRDTQPAQRISSRQG
ncbi:serine/arginine repetitive matrix protein 1-like [Palaemon carinicauda]|uniref:serine/arginine repetitive matrix protein 1-like n=1 Tax=Palaemon carinicauda TaxID=392227 RepID=UPI0035B5C0B8